MVKVGDKINIKQSLITTEGEKALIDIFCYQYGVCKKIKISVVDKMSTGKLIMVLYTEK
ncbi:MAG: biotin/lipoyl-containing protein [Arsenophonus sp. NC-CH8-MAG3]